MRPPALITFDCTGTLFESIKVIAAKEHIARTLPEPPLEKVGTLEQKRCTEEEEIKTAKIGISWHAACF